MVPVAEASLSLCPVLPVNDLLEDKIKVHVAGVPLSSVATDCRLGRVVGPSGCDDVERQKAQGVLLRRCTSERSGSLACRTVPRLQRGSEVPLLL